MLGTRVDVWAYSPSKRVVENEDRDTLPYRKLGYDKESELAKETLLDEEIRHDEEVLVPSQKISTLGDLGNFHQKLIELCLTESKSISASINELKKWLETGIKLKKEFNEPSKILIRSVNDEIQFEKGRFRIIDV